jgi:hypothetical protein
MKPWGKRPSPHAVNPTARERPYLAGTKARLAADSVWTVGFQAANNRPAWSRGGLVAFARQFVSVEHRSAGVFHFHDGGGFLSDGAEPHRVIGRAGAGCPLRLEFAGCGAE